MSMGNSFRRMSVVMRALAIAVGTAAMLAGCGESEQPRTDMSSDPLDLATVPVYKALEGTIGQFAVFIDAAPMPVEGWGLVVGLPGTGAGDMSPEISRGLLMNNGLYRKGLGSYVKGTETMNPERILASNEVAAVEVRGLIPPMAKVGDKFDLQIKAIPSTQVTSLTDGLLWTSELRQIGFQVGLETQMLAINGARPMFIPAVVRSSNGNQVRLSMRLARDSTGDCDTRATIGRGDRRRGCDGAAGNSAAIADGIESDGGGDRAGDQ